MSTITRAEVEAILSRIHEANERGGVGITRDEGEKLARIAMASLDAEPLTDPERQELIKLRKEDALRRKQWAQSMQHDPTLGGILPKL